MCEKFYNFCNRFLPPESKNPACRLCVKMSVNVSRDWERIWAWNCERNWAENVWENPPNTICGKREIVRESDWEKWMRKWAEFLQNVIQKCAWKWVWNWAEIERENEQRKQQGTTLFCVRKKRENVCEKLREREFMKEKLWEKIEREIVRENEQRFVRENERELSGKLREKMRRETLRIMRKKCEKMRENFYKNLWIFCYKNNTKYVKIKTKNVKTKQTKNPRKYTRKFKQHHFTKWFLQLKITHKNLTKSFFRRLPYNKKRYPGQKSQTTEAARHPLCITKGRAIWHVLLFSFH